MKNFELLRDSTIPAGLIQIVPGTGNTVGTQLAQHPDIQLISLTGSMKAGKSVYAESANTVKKVNLELGGNAPVLVTEHADIDKAVDYIVTEESIIWTSMYLSGTCICP